MQDYAHDCGVKVTLLWRWGCGCIAAFTRTEVDVQHLIVWIFAVWQNELSCQGARESSFLLESDNHIRVIGDGNKGLRFVAAGDVFDCDAARHALAVGWVVCAIVIVEVVDAWQRSWQGGQCRGHTYDWQGGSVGAQALLKGGSAGGTPPVMAKSQPTPQLRPTRQVMEKMIGIISPCPIMPSDDAYRGMCANMLSNWPSTNANVHLLCDAVSVIFETATLGILNDMVCLKPKHDSETLPDSDASKATHPCREDFIDWIG